MNHQENGPAVEREPNQVVYASESLAFKPDAVERERQRAVMLSALRRAPLSTVEARERYGVLSPAARVYEMRKAGRLIVTVSRTDIDALGRPHRVAFYVLTEGVQ